MITDELDKRILQQMSKGISSYDELARECDVTRSTIYRRVAMLEKNGLSRRATRSIVDYAKLDIAAVCVMARVAQAIQERVLKALRNHKNVKFLWRAYGEYDIVAVAFCNRGEEGEIINEIGAVLELCGTSKVHVSVGFSWEKMELTPFNEETLSETQTSFYYVDNEKEADIETLNK